MQKLAVESAAKSDDSAQDKRKITDDSVKNTPKLIEGFYDIVAEYYESWKQKCIEIDKITEKIFMKFQQLMNHLGRKTKVHLIQLLLLHLIILLHLLSL